MFSETAPASQDALQTRISLLQRACENSSPLAWKELLGFYEPFVSKVLGSMGFRGSDLDDARQQVFLRLWKGLQSYERDPARAKFRTWFARLIRNTAYNMFRSKRRQPSGPSMDDLDPGLESALADEPAIVARVEQEWQKYVVDLALDRARAVFSGHAVEVFTRSLEGESVEDIASALNIKNNTVHILKHRVKKVLLNEIRQLKTDLETMGDVSAP